MSALRATILLISIFICSNFCQSTPLDDYVNAPDPTFGWNVIETYSMPDYKLYILNFTSQKWLDEKFSTRSIWWHYLCITVPNKLNRNQLGFLYIDGGSNTDPIPKPEDNSVSLISMLSVSTGTVTAGLQDIPNVPIRFPADPTNKTRDDNAAVAWTWKAFLDDPSNPASILFLPMTKASVRAMDAVQQFLKSIDIEPPQKFVVAGASKRGWTTWTTAAVASSRVVAAVPIVMDLINLQKNLHHMFRSLVGWTFAFRDFYPLNIFPSIDTDNFTQMAQIMDPMVYFDRYVNMTVLQIQTTGDEFFLLDYEELFWDDLQRITGGTYLRRIPNAEHSCAGHEISLLFTIRSFYLSVYDQKPLPNIKWNKSSNNTHGSIRATVDFSIGPKPISATGYRSRTLNNLRRDFRLAIADTKDPTQPKINPVFWFTTPVVIEEQSNTTIVYSMTIENPLNGWEAFFIQVNFPGPSDSVLELTTETKIVPDTYPTADCRGSTCAGSLV